MIRLPRFGTRYPDLVWCEAESYPKRQFRRRHVKIDVKGLWNLQRARFGTLSEYLGPVTCWIAWTSLSKSIWIKLLNVRQRGECQHCRSRKVMVLDIWLKVYKRLTGHKRRWWQFSGNRNSLGHRYRNNRTRLWYNQATLSLHLCSSSERQAALCLWISARHPLVHWAWKNKGRSNNFDNVGLAFEF